MRLDSTLAACQNMFTCAPCVVEHAVADQPEVGVAGERRHGRPRRDDAALVDDLARLVRDDLGPHPPILRRPARHRVARGDVVDDDADRAVPVLLDDAERGRDRRVEELLERRLARRRRGESRRGRLIDREERVHVVLPREDVRRLRDRLEPVAPRQLLHVALAARVSQAGVREERRLPVGVRPLDGRPGRRDDVVARPAERRRTELVAVVEHRVGRGMRDVGDRVRVLAAHRDVAGEDERVVVGPLDGVHRVAEEAGHAVELLRHGVEVEPVGRGFLVQGHRGVALDAEIAELPARLALPALVHRAEDGVVRGVGVHARGPVGVVVGVALLARVGIEQRRAREVGGRALRRARDRRRRGADDREDYQPP